MHLSKDVQQALKKIGSVTMTTLDQETLHSRIISICGSDDLGIYFLTMEVKPFYRQLKKNSNLALCGIYPSGRRTGKNPVGQPTFAPGFTLRLSGRAREIPADEVRQKADAGSEIHKYFLEDAARYPAIRFFCIHRGKGEIYDFDLKWRTGTTSSCAAGLPLAGKPSMRQGRISIRPPASPAGRVLRPVHSRPSSRENPIA